MFAGWAFLGLFEQLSWVVLIAFVIPAVDAISVWHGPTKAITAHHFEVYTAVAIAFLVPGGGAAYLGPPDVLFYALFLAAAARWRLRVFWTWFGMIVGVLLHDRARERARRRRAAGAAVPLVRVPRLERRPAVG